MAKFIYNNFLINKVSGLFKSAPKNIRWLVVISLLLLAIMTIDRLVVFFAFRITGQTMLGSLNALVLGIRYDLREAGIVAITLLLFASLKPINPFVTRFGKILWLTLLSVFTVLLLFVYVADFIHYDYLHQRLNASALNFLHDAGISFNMVVQTYPVIKITLLLLALSFVAILLINKTYKKIAAQNTERVTAKNSWTWGIILFILYGLGIYGHLGQYPLRWSDAFALGDDQLSQLALNPVQSFVSSLGFTKDTYDKKKVTDGYARMASYLGVTNPDRSKLDFGRSYVASDSSTPNYNVVLVICESFSAYKSSMWGNPLNTTPFFSQLCNQGVFFNHCYTPHFGTARGVWATITSIPDVELNKTASRNPALADQHTIINDMNGYEKYYFIGGSTSWANMRALLDNNIGGLHLFEQDNYDAPKVDVWGISDKNLFLQANKKLNAARKPFFAVIQTSDNHRPYTIPDEDKKEFTVVQFPVDTLRRYGFQSNAELNAFRYTDFCFKKFIEAAMHEDYFKNTVFVFVGDHGIRGDAAAMFPRAWTDNGLTCFHVPLLFYAPGILPPARHTANCSQVDILPTVAGILKKKYRNTALGRDLFHISDTTSNVSFMIDHDLHQTGVVKGDYFYTIQAGSGKEQLMSVINDKKIPAGRSTDSLRQSLKTITEDFYETSRYMIYNNKKNIRQNRQE